MFTILGSHGFIGSYLRQSLEQKGIECYCPHLNTELSGHLNNVICCVGLTADFRERPLDTVESHVCYLVNLFRKCRFDSFVYLSSTRIYGLNGTKEEDILQVSSIKFEDIYNISKIMGEAVCFTRENIKVVRLSNVYGYDEKSENFVFTLIRDALNKKLITLNTTYDSCKDHISINDVVNILPEIALHGKYKLYNVASGQNTAVQQITDKLSEITNCSVLVNKDAQRVCLPKINIDRLASEFVFKPSNIIDGMESLVETYRKEIDDSKRRAEWFGQ